MCGCDGVTYWNASYAASLGRSVAASPKGACSGVGTATCGGIASKACPHAGEVCVYQYDSAAMCGISDPAGKCWLFPAGGTCPTVIFKNSSECGGAGSGKCMSACDAIKGGKPFYRDSTCPV